LSQNGSERRPDRRRRRAVTKTLIVAGSVLVTATGCSFDQLPRLGLPTPRTTSAPGILHLWQGSWIAALAVGVVVWGLILWSCFFHRRKRTGVEIPKQTRYNLPIELLYTAVPFVLIGVLFFFTAKDESDLLKLKPNPSVYVNVVGRQWSWSFNYNYDAATQKSGMTPDPVVYDAGTPGQPPTLYLPVGERVRFTLTSADVIHSFWVPSFLFKLDVVPGRVNEFEVTPDVKGRFIGRCAELCGVDHSRMIFWVDVVSKTDFEAKLAQLQKDGDTGQLPVGVIVDRGGYGQPGPENGIGGDKSGVEQ
jgi:cytochrome c oxidase subunit 2